MESHSFRDEFPRGTDYGEIVMINDGRSQVASRRKPPWRRAVLLGSAAALTAVALAAGMGELGWLPTTLAAPQAVAANDQLHGPESFAPLVDRIKSAVVSVRVKLTRPGGVTDQVLPVPRNSPFRRFFEQPGQKQEVVTGEGSGFFISPDGYIVTNNHVAGHAQTVQVTTEDGDIHSAKVVGTDERSDLALIKIDADRQFPYVKFADRPPRVGDWVIAVGNPFGLGGTVTAGIVSARGRDIATNPYDAYLQIDAPINKGNSGGPAFDMSGNVVGVNTAIYSPSGGSVGIGFDVPADTARRVIDQLKQKGYVTRGWLGVEVQPVTSAIADSLGMKKAEGALVDQPQAGSPAEKAGVKAGDVVLSVNGQPVKDARALAEKISAASPGDKVQLTVLRDGQNQTLNVTLVQMPNQEQQANAGGEQEQQPQQQQPSTEPRLGLSLAPAKDVQGSGGEGVVVLNVDPSGPAAQDGVQSGDVILDAGGKTVQTPVDVRHAIDQSRSQGRHSILMRMKTAAGMRFVALPVG
jgi:serine protease Do